jgi:cytochrome c peroxidase
MSRHFFLGMASLSLALVTSARLPTQPSYDWMLPAGFPPPTVPADNPMSVARAELGRRLFYDSRLSANQTQSCATCHQQTRAFTDGRAGSVGSTGEVHRRGSMSLVNVAYAQALTWANPSMTRLEDQALVPMFGDHPIELGLDGADSWIGRLRSDPVYPPLMAAAFPGESRPFTRENVVKAIATFERTIVSARSPYDRYHFDRDETAISEAARRGEVLFHSRPLSCFTCHGGIHFSNAMGPTRSPRPVEFHNTGLYNLAAAFSYPATDTGLFEISHQPGDVGKFKAPTLRNIAVTAPYMHDGSISTLEAVIDHYAAGGRTIATGPNQGIGHDNPGKSPSIHGFALTSDQKTDLLAFLQSLTDEPLLHDPDSPIRGVNVCRAECWDDGERERVQGSSAFAKAMADKPRGRAAATGTGFPAALE